MLIAIVCYSSGISQAARHVAMFHEDTLLFWCWLICFELFRCRSCDLADSLPFRPDSSKAESRVQWHSSGVRREVMVSEKLGSSLRHILGLLTFVVSFGPIFWPRCIETPVTVALHCHDHLVSAVGLLSIRHSNVFVCVFNLPRFANAFELHLTHILHMTWCFLNFSSSYSHLLLAQLSKCGQTNLLAGEHTWQYQIPHLRSHSILWTSNFPLYSAAAGYSSMHHTLVSVIVLVLTRIYCRIVFIVLYSKCWYYTLHIKYDIPTLTLFSCPNQIDLVPFSHH